MMPLLASSFLDYSGFTPYFAAVALAGAGAMVLVAARRYGRAGDRRRAQYRRWGKWLLVLALAWIAVSAAVAFVVRSS